MRQDIVDVLKTSRMDLVRDLIGLPPYAVHRWHMAYLKILAGIAFQTAGREHKAKRDGHISQFHQFRHGSAPVLPESSEVRLALHVHVCICSPMNVCLHIQLYTCTLPPMCMHT